MYALLISLLLAAAAPESAQYDFGEVCARMAAAPLHRVEGVWQIPADGGLLAIERAERADAGTEYVMAVVAVSNRLLHPGTIIGRITPTAKPEVFEATLFTAVDRRGRPSRPKKFTLTLANDDSRLEIRHIRKGVRLNWWRLFPYMFRGVVTPVDETPRDLDGCVRVFPEPAVPANPRYL